MAGPLQDNPPTANIHITNGASDWLWAVCALMSVSMLFTLFWSHMQPLGQRAFHHTATVILFVSAVAYFAMASDLGQTAVATEFRDTSPGSTRNVFWVRYIQWAINGPLIIIMVLLTTGLALSDVFLTAFMTLAIVVMGLVGALTPSSYKWGFFVFGLFALFYVFTSLWGLGSRTSLNAGGATHRRFFNTGSGWISFIWPLYFICWGLSEGGNRISPTGEMIFYGILDLFAGPLFLFTHLWALRSLDYAAFGLQSGKASDYAGVTGTGVGAGPAGAGTGTNGVGTSTGRKEAEAGVV
ncbi:family A G protein-coupled receptor-like protein [Stereum hirsutum FP-91666 SS1]|uniref:family A G protein-coupled receptor-like protein n=1 Tax=Stereum hirsutum (strain FP-91666) TaxID=721885 RepID=UPI000444989B|nr:family A G protein-coupled receptor-like protein [Stereum hirsutum FP-91666 SS1]EIM80840.1 family A G protein-coupled receptor-like protein [Stereum hirsutum FP-91666 SS1]